MSTATKSPSRLIPLVIPLGLGGLGLLFLLAGVLLPADRGIATLAGPTPPTRDQLLLGARLFKACLVVDAFLLLAGAFVRVGIGRPHKKPAGASSSSLAFFQTNPAASLFAGPPESRLARGAATAALLGLLVAGTVLRAWNLNSDLWLDEIGSLITYIRLPFGQIVTRYSTPNQHLFYSLLSHASLAIFGESAAAIRWPAVLFGVAGLWGVYRLARLTESRTDALLVAALLAVSYHHIFFSQNARGYTLFLFLALIGTVLFVRALETDRTGLWAAYVAVTVLNMYNHLNAVFIFLGQIGTYALMRLARRRAGDRSWPRMRRVLTVALLTGFFTFHLYAWVIPEMLTFYATADRTAVGWSLLSADFFREFAKGLQLGFSSGLAVAGVLVIGVVGTVSYWRQNFWAGVLFALPSVFGVLAVWLLRVGTYPRFFLFALPIALIMLVRGARMLGEWIARHFHWRAAATAWLGLIITGAIAVSLRALVPYYRLPKQDFTGALAFIHASSDAAAPIVGADMAYVCAHYYDATVRPADSPAEIEPLRRQGQPIWLMYIFPTSIRLRRPALYQYIDEHFTLVRQFPGTVGDGTVYVCRSKREKE